MAPGYRANGQSRRANRGLVDHDIFEGLPVRNWRRDNVTVAPPPPPDLTTQKDKWDIELPYGMPKDSHLLAQHSQDILRLARSGRLYQKRPSMEDDEADPDPMLGEKPDKKEEPTKEGFVVKTWKQVPRHLEGPEIEYLAKRRKNLKGQAVKNGVVAGPTMTKTTVRRTDAQGNSYTEDLVVPEGQTVDGEVISQVVISDPATTGAVVEVPTPIKRRPAPPRRKAKGPGRGRRKKAPLPPTSVPGTLGAAPTETKTEDNGGQEPVIGPDGVKVEQQPQTNGQNANGNEDTPMEDVDQSQLPSDDDGEDGEEDGSEDDNEGEGDGDDDQDQDQDDSQHENDNDNATLDTMDFSAVPDVGSKEKARDTSSSPDAPLAPKSTSHLGQGSPLKHAVSPPPSHQHGAVPIEDDEAEADGDDDDDDVDILQHNQPRDNEEGPPIPENYYLSDQQRQAAEQGYGGSVPIQDNENEDDDEMLLDHDNDDEDQMLNDHSDGDEMLLDNENLEFMDHTNPAAFPNPTDLETDENGNSMPIEDQPHDQLAYGHGDDGNQTYGHIEGVPTSTSEYVHQVEEEAQREQEIPPVGTDDVISRQIIDAAGTGEDHSNAQQHHEDAHESYADLLGSLDDHLNEQSHESNAEAEAGAKSIDVHDNPVSAVIVSEATVEDVAIDETPVDEIVVGEALVDAASIEEALAPEVQPVAVVEEVIIAPELIAEEEVQIEEPVKEEELVVVAEPSEKIDLPVEEEKIEAKEMVDAKIEEPKIQEEETTEKEMADVKEELVESKAPEIEPVIAPAQADE